ncbi:MAG: hypothetical protein HOP12_14655, partial [Candidatus Eisenbacteria bacterium]|nr:hypothetical protein [Candidatus Eisenbacteria bacterium]
MTRSTRPNSNDPRPLAAQAWERVTLLLVAALAAVLSALAFGPHRIGDYFTETDFYGAYAIGARAIQHGQLDATRYGVIGPVYELVLALVGALTGDLLRAAELISIVSMTAAVWLTTRLVARLTDARIGCATAAFLVVNPTLLQFGYSATTDALALALAAGASVVA